MKQVLLSFMFCLGLFLAPSFGQDCTSILINDESAPVATAPEVLDAPVALDQYELFMGPYFYTYSYEARSAPLRTFALRVRTKSRSMAHRALSVTSKTVTRVRGATSRSVTRMRCAGQNVRYRMRSAVCR